MRVLLAGLLLALLAPAVTYADDEPTHDLGNQTLCVDATSVMVRLEGLEQRRATSVRPKLIKELDQLLKSSLADGGLDYSSAASCRASEGFVALYVRVTVLDPRTYRHHGPQAFGYALALQVGDYAVESFLREHHLLPDQRFEAFDEEVYSEAKNPARFESYLVTRAQTLFDTLVEAWQLDNP